MPGMAQRIGDIAERILAFREEAKSWDDDTPTEDGWTEASMADELKLLAVSGYHVRHDIVTFKANLAEAATLYISLFERSTGAMPVEDVVTEVRMAELPALLEPSTTEAVADGADDVRPSLLTMVTYKELFNALASGDLAVAERLAALMGSYLDPEVLYDQPLDHYLGWTLKYMVDDLPDPIRRNWVEWLEGYVRQEWPTLIGYPMVMRAIVDGDLAAAQAGFIELLEGHRKESRKGKLFGDTEDEVICVWGGRPRQPGAMARVAGRSARPADPVGPAGMSHRCLRLMTD